MKKTRMQIIGAFKSLSWLADQDVDTYLSLRILNVMLFHNEIKKEIDDYSAKISSENDNLEEVGLKISDFINEEVEVKWTIPFDDLMVERIKISASKLSDLLVFMDKT